MPPPELTELFPEREPRAGLGGLASDSEQRRVTKRGGRSVCRGVRVARHGPRVRL